MIVTKISPLTGIEHTLDLDITEEEIANYDSGTLAQNAFPNLSEGELEFIISGITEDEWDIAFPENDEDDFDEDEPAF